MGISIHVQLGCINPFFTVATIRYIYTIETTATRKQGKANLLCYGLSPTLNLTGWQRTDSET